MKEAKAVAPCSVREIPYDLKRSPLSAISQRTNFHKAIFSYVSLPIHSRNARIIRKIFRISLLRHKKRFTQIHPQLGVPGLFKWPVLFAVYFLHWRVTLPVGNLVEQPPSENLETILEVCYNIT